jgi:hypothetical protein
MQEVGTSITTFSRPSWIQRPCSRIAAGPATLETLSLRIIFPVMTPPTTLIVYTDYKSPYAFLAKDRVYALADDTGAEMIGGRMCWTFPGISAVQPSAMMAPWHPAQHA